MPPRPFSLTLIGWWWIFVGTFGTGCSFVVFHILIPHRLLQERVQSPSPISADLVSWTLLASGSLYLFCGVGLLARQGWVRFLFLAHAVARLAFNAYLMLGSFTKPDATARLDEANDLLRSQAAVGVIWFIGEIVLFSFFLFRKPARQYFAGQIEIQFNELTDSGRIFPAPPSKLSDSGRIRPKDRTQTEP